MPIIVIIAGPNGAGKTTFARRLAPRLEGATFVNADEIERSLGAVPHAALRAGRELIQRLNDLVSAKADVILETTLASRRYLKAIENWRGQGYEVVLYYLRLPSASVAVERVARRVAAGGHEIPEAVIRRRFDLSLEYLEAYKPCVHSWYLFDSLEGDFDFVLSGEQHEPEANQN